MHYSNIQLCIYTHNKRDNARGKGNVLKFGFEINYKYEVHYHIHLIGFM